jgi:guanosine-3',5'-bis(diphosphate) 3'-pyrophosphohydrolase
MPSSSLSAEPLPGPTSPELIDKSLSVAAPAIARRAHAGQQRKHTGDPYIVHPARVAARLALRFPDDAALIAAGWCHDVLEDCPHISPDELRAVIGDDAFSIVLEVTNPSKGHPSLSRADRKALDRAHIATISKRARCLKLADRADNLLDGCHCCPDRAWLETYTRESVLLAEVLRGSDDELEADLDRALAAAALKTDSEQA